MKYRNCYLSFSLIFQLIIATTCFSALPKQTPLEQNNYQKLPSSQEINDFLTVLTTNTNNSRLVKIGKSAGGRDITALLISNDPQFLKTGKAAKNKLTVLMIGSQHGMEPSGCEGLQKLALQFASRQLDTFLKGMNLILVVNGNPDGRDLSSRFNAVNGNINIDFIKQTYPETRVYTQVLNKYQPDAILDLHESSIKKKVLTLEQGFTTVVDAQYEIGNNPNIHPALLTYSQKTLLPELIAITAKKGLSSTHYKGEIQTLNQPIAHGGLHASNYRNYSALHGSLSFLVENRLDTPDENYPTPGNIQVRKEKQYTSAFSFLTLLHNHQQTILKKARLAQAEWKKTQALQYPITFFSKYNLNPQNPTIEIPLQNAKTHEQVKKTFENYDFVDQKNILPLADAYVVRSFQQEIAALLSKHHIQYTVVDKPKTVLAMPLTVTAIQVKLPKNPKYQSSVEVDTRYSLSEQALAKGDLIVFTHQPLGRLAAILLDPRSMDSIYQALQFRTLLVKNALVPIYPIKYRM